MTRLALIATAAAALSTLGSAAVAAPLLLIGGGDTSVIVLDLGARARTGDIRTAPVYRGQIAKGGQSRSITGEKHAFDCPGRRQRLVANLTRTPAGKTEEAKVEAAWEPIVWKSPMDYAAAAVCLDIYDDDKVSSKTDVPSMLASLEQVWEPGHYQPPIQQREPRKKRSWMRPF